MLNCVRDDEPRRERRRLERATVTLTTRAVWEDPRVRAGFSRQLAERERRLRSGERPVGWKVAFGNAAVQEDLGLSGPLLGHLTDSSALAGPRCQIGSWAQPALEAELAIELGAPLGGGADRDEAAAAIVGIGAAVELVDFDRPATELESVIADDIFHRAYALGPVDRDRAGGSSAGIEIGVSCDGQEVAVEHDPERALGDLIDLTLHVAHLLAAFELQLSAGEVIISGSAVGAIPLRADTRLRCEYGALPALDVEAVA
jgi:2-keto-4-pentenoate hydratase